jgi:hypothetical protein
MRSVIALLAFVVMAGAAPAALAQPAAAPTQTSAARDAARESLRQVLDTVAKLPAFNTSFRRSDKQPYNFVASMSGLPNTDSLEIVVSVTTVDTIGFRIYPHYKGGYINLGKAKDREALEHRLLVLSDKNFLYWGADDTDDIFCAYTFTLESGFPGEAIKVVLLSISNTDGFVGQLRPMIDGSTAVAK